MAPVAIQSLFSFRMAEGGGVSNTMGSAETRNAVLATNLNSCHVWAEGGEQVTTIRNGEPMEIPVWLSRRFEKLGLDSSSWRPGT
jgi:hypothetical protein